MYNQTDKKRSRSDREGCAVQCSAVLFFCCLAWSCPSCPCPPLSCDPSYTVVQVNQDGNAWQGTTQRHGDTAGSGEDELRLSLYSHRSYEQHSHTEYST